MSRGGHRAAERRVLQLLHGRSTRSRLRDIHAHVLRHGLERSTALLAHFLAVCSSLRRTPYAARLFSQLHHPNLLLFNAMIKAHSLSPAPSSSSEPFRLFSLMRRRGIHPDRLTFAPLLKSSSNLADVRLGRSIHASVVAFGFESHAPVAIGILELYAYTGQMVDARKVFEAMPHGDVVVGNLMISGFCRQGDLESGYRLFREMSEYSVVSWNSIIAGLARAGWNGEALELFREMWDVGYEPDDATLVTVLPVCSRLGALAVGRWIHAYADWKGLLRDAVNVGNALVDMYCKCGDLEGAKRIFDGMPRKSVVSWNTMINGLAFNGRGDAGVDVFEEMTRSDIEPNAGTFVGVLGCCTHAGLVERGRKLFDLMRTKHRIQPKVEHYGGMVDLLGRCGFVKEARELIMSMPMMPTAAIWGALLSASRNYGDLDIAEIAARELIKLEPWNTGNYVLLSNLYAENGRWGDVDSLRLLMKERCAQKAPGQSAIELVGNS